MLDSDMQDGFRRDRVLACRPEFCYCGGRGIFSPAYVRRTVLMIFSKSVFFTGK